MAKKKATKKATSKKAKPVKPTAVVVEPEDDELLVSRGGEPQAEIPFRELEDYRWACVRLNLARMADRMKSIRDAAYEKDKGKFPVLSTNELLNLALTGQAPVEHSTAKLAQLLHDGDELPILKEELRTEADGTIKYVLMLDFGVKGCPRFSEQIVDLEKFID